MATELQFDMEPASEDQPQCARPEAPRRASMAVNVRTIEYMEYDSDGLEFITSQQIAEDLSSNGEGEHHALSDEEGRHEKYEERVPHRLVLIIYVYNLDAWCDSFPF